jgi:hypothetical protein
MWEGSHLYAGNDITGSCSGGYGSDGTCWVTRRGGAAVLVLCSCQRRWLWMMQAWVEECKELQELNRCICSCMKGSNRMGAG